MSLLEKKKEEICRFGRKLWERSYVASNDGNLSVRLEEDIYLITPTGVSKGELTPEMILCVNGGGETLAPSDYRLSSEWRMHLECYRQRPDIGAVVHAHPVAATALACARRPLEAPFLGEFLMALGEVPVAPYGRTGTEEIPKAIAPLLAAHDGILLANHGALTLGADVETAYYKMESLEHAARIFLALLPLGGGVPLSPREAAALKPRKKDS
ncbi:MAG: class II aldolase/adducin family protein [Oscillospiraceae bacterium]|nr:class II aldolase/adducin family protein [Oscillospiraceae bacterium]